MDNVYDFLKLFCVLQSAETDKVPPVLCFLLGVDKYIVVGA